MIFGDSELGLCSVNGECWSPWTPQLGAAAAAAGVAAPTASAAVSRVGDLGVVSSFPRLLQGR